MFDFLNFIRRFCKDREARLAPNLGGATVPSHPPNLPSPSLLRDVALCAEKAGKLIAKQYALGNFTIRQKEDKTPVTQADLDAHQLIETELHKLSPHVVISEETYQDPKEVPEHKPFWLVDPIDGTKEFIRKSGHFTVNIALIEGQFPTLGVIYVPVTEELYYAQHGFGSYRRDKDGNVSRLHTTEIDRKALRFLISRHSKETIDALKKRWPGATVHSMGSSLKYCRIAEGQADLCVRHLQTYEWDTAAAQCILEEAGGKLVDFNGDRLRYRKPRLLNSGFVAIGDASVDIVGFL